MDPHKHPFLSPFLHDPHLHPPAPSHSVPASRLPIPILHLQTSVLLPMSPELPRAILILGNQEKTRVAACKEPFYSPGPANPFSNRVSAEGHGAPGGIRQQGRAGNKAQTSAHTQGSWSQAPLLLHTGFNPSSLSYTHTSSAIRSEGAARFSCCHVTFKRSRSQLLGVMLLISFILHSLHPAALQPWAACAASSNKELVSTQCSGPYSPAVRNTWQVSVSYCTFIPS